MNKISDVHKILAYLYLIRSFEVLLIAGTGSITLILLGISDLLKLTELFTILLLGAAGVLTWNDTLDIVEDSVAHPERPVISGDVGVLEARVIGTVLLLLSLAVSLNFAINAALLGLLGIAISILYSFTSKSRFIVIAPMKNLVVAGVTALFLALLPSALELSASWIYFLFVLSLVLILFGYEILKDIRDVNGDRAAGYQTLPLRRGIVNSGYTAAFFFAISCILMSWGLFNVGYLTEAVISLVTTLIVLIPFYYLKKHPDPESSDVVRYAVVFILLLSIGSIGMLLYLRLISA